ncbi:MAG: metallopeptidase TldD-related protein, partial [Betaproteobacteria bacterium]|nr:metallopeptidase TldD-related protein [Betaproteobacteria bacterium]
ISPVLNEIYSFARSEDELRTLAQEIVAQAKAAGADAVEVSVGESFGLTIGVRGGELETSEFGQDRNASIGVVRKRKSGSASCESLSGRDLKAAIDKALAIAASSQEDECAGPADAEHLAAAPFADLDLHHPWRPSVDQATRIALECEQASFDADPRVSREKSEGAEISSVEARGAYANSHGFAMASTASSHAISCSALAQGGQGMETGGWHSSQRNWRQLEDAAAVGRKAGQRAAARDGAQMARTAEVAAVFESGVSHSLIGCLLGAASGGNLYRKLSYLRGKMGDKVATEHLTIREDPFIPAGKRSRVCDDEGVAVQARNIVEAGVLTGYLLSSYSARKLGMKTTGNAGGAHNLSISCRSMGFADLLAEMGEGFLITELMGRGANLVTGDYSCGAAGFWVEGGKISHPIREATVAGSLPVMLAGIVAGGDDILERGGISCGSLLIDKIALGGRK